MPRAVLLLLLSPSSSALRVGPVSFTNIFSDTALRAQTQSVRGRSYANMTKLSSFRDPVVRTELNTPSELRQGPATAWITAPYRLSVLAACWMLYPPLILSLRSLLSPATLTGVMNAGGMPGDGLPLDAGAITSGFAPAISLLYGA
ncbi:hypothetical protein EMIHUDRAFT_255885, partial [Emiliania huxleyi CCMP1516]